MTSSFVGRTLLLLALLLFSACGRGEYLFISDHYFAVLEGDALREELGRKVEIEEFTSPPEAAKVLTLAAGRRPAGLVFSPLYYSLAEAVARLDPGVPVYAVLPPEHTPQDSLNGAVFDLAGAGRLILQEAEESFPSDGPESVLLIFAATAEGSGWSFIEDELKVRFPSGSVESHALPLQPDSAAEFLSLLRRGEYDLLLILASGMTPGLTEALLGEFPEAVFICDHPPQDASGMEGGYLVYRWERLYSALLEGKNEADGWEFRPFGSLSAP